MLPQREKGSDSRSHTYGVPYLTLLPSLHWLARAQPEQLYLPEEVVHRSEYGFSLEHGVALPSALQNNPLIQRGEPVRVERQPGRNEPCPCGSGRKSKKCCGLTAPRQDSTAP